jgi:hypothetical protein
VNTVILNWQRPLWEGDQEVVMRSGRGEPVWVVIHICIVTTLGIFLYYLYLKLEKNAIFFLLSLMFFLQQSRRTRRQNRSCLQVGVGGEVAQIMYTHVSKCKNDKIKLKKKRKKQGCEMEKMFCRFEARQEVCRS